MNEVQSGAKLSESETERLSLIRYQLLSAFELLKQPAPINVLAINTMQDVVESALAAVGEHIRAEVKARSDFDKLFDSVVSKLSSPPELLGLRASAIALNNARVGFKHHGNQVREETLRRHHDVAVTLVYELVRAGFGLKLDDVSLLAFIHNAGVRDFIERAEVYARENNLAEALSYLRSAFDMSVDDYASRKSLNGWDTIFDVAPRRIGHVRREGGGWERPLEDMESWVRALDQRVRLSAIGVDLSRYAYFDAVAPVHDSMWHSGRGPYVNVRFEAPTDDHYKESYRFVVDTAIRLAATEFNLAPLREGIRPAESYDPAFRSEEYVRYWAEVDRREAEREFARESNPDG